MEIDLRSKSQLGSWGARAGRKELFVDAFAGCRKSAIYCFHTTTAPPYNLLPSPMPGFLPYARLPSKRRTATSVFAGYFDPLPERDVLTSLLNGVGPNKEVEAKEEMRKAKRKKDSRKRPDASPRRDTLIDLTVAPPAPPIASSSKPQPVKREPRRKKSFWTARQGRPNIQLMPVERSVSVTPPPGFLPARRSRTSDTPTSRRSNSTSTSRRSSKRPQRGRSISASTSRTSSKRPRTPDDDEDIEERPKKKKKKKKRKKRVAHRKGWKGWVEGSPTPSDKLINLDAVLVFKDRRTRSGKNFDAISVGTDTWV